VYGIVPLDVFESSELPVLAVDAGGRIRYYNPATAELAGCDPGEWIGRPCWRFARLRACNGAQFCGRDCPVQRGARDGTSPGAHPVLFRRPARDPIRLNLLSFILPPQRKGRWAVLHMLEPAREPASAVLSGPDSPAIEPAVPAPVQVDHRLALLTRREKEILGALADGLDVAAIADRLCISDFTVRNHIQHILHKLRLHRQVDAILMLLEKHPGAHPQR